MVGKHTEQLGSPHMRSVTDFLRFRGCTAFYSSDRDSSEVGYMGDLRHALEQAQFIEGPSGDFLTLYHIPDADIAVKIFDWRSSVMCGVGRYILRNYKAWRLKHPDFEMVVSPQDLNGQRNRILYSGNDKPTDELTDREANIVFGADGRLLLLDTNNVKLAPDPKSLDGLWLWDDIIELCKKSLSAVSE
jgi:hypothetical protein